MMVFPIAVSFLNFVSVSLLRTNIHMQFSFILVFVQEILLILTHHIFLLAPLTNH
jgi:hypothetical protein